MADAFPASSLTARTAPRTAKEELLAAEASMSADQLIQHWGYPGERHSIPTEDGYLLTLQRIPWSRDAGQAEQAGQAAQAGQARPVVLLQHGLLQTADQWLLRGPGQDLALLMSDQGYDVWLGNFRGNTYCKNHMTMSKDNAQFWDFSWHENGFYDLAATIDYVLAVTGQPSLSYIGHSMGTTALLVLLATRPEYNRRVRVASLLAPVAYFSRPRGLTAMLFPITRKIEHDVRAVHMELLPLGSVPRSAVGALCRPGAPTATLCMAAYSHTTGPDPRQMNATLLPTVLSHVPAGSSLGQFVHYAQVQKSGLFRQYDHGVRGNTLRYGQPQPPLYNLSSVVAPVLFHYSTGDYLAHPKGALLGSSTR
ncbi:lipase 3-like isoform X2 [Thrips palmi]|uniref:Lipase 3-like isoform X2 n=1 Tax=Thrips palmi TaxID=161013 RepID=A0A6P8ZW88_THRPL|nr:lipase 3-like isoform X2 [Thrips palmi]